ncbi:probable insulin-like peptide 3 [Musca vetustissima]|uniref:probable insulin-like peptide 3 n=1 Tax=Musca vetustissima TaxID=27455 RepID=UPI002AB697A3|nr:probable insulin-like peptide 3 [Musca vetustissima]
MKLLAALVFLAICYEIQSAATRFCGQNLVQVLDAVCVDGFYGMQISKKSTNKPMLHGLTDIIGFNEIDGEPHYDPDSQLSRMLHSESMNGLAKTRRQRHLNGVYDECCRKGCTLQELAGYCL